MADMATPDTSIIMAAGQIPAEQMQIAQAGQQIAANNMALNQQRRHNQQQNLLAKLYQDPKNVQGGVLTPQAMNQVMAIDPQTGMALQQQQLKTEDAQIGVKSDQLGYLAQNVSTPAIEAYQEALKTMPQQAALGVGQSVYSDGLKQAQASGLFSADQSAAMPQNFDPVRVAGGLQTYQQYQTQQLDQQKTNIDQEKADTTRDYDRSRGVIAGAAAGIDPNTGLPLPDPGTSGTSVDGAVGPMQIKPGTFAQFAKPGQDINNPVDNIAVGNKIVSTYAAQYGGDPARVATAYFSGPNNVAQAGSAQPYIKNAVDGNGKPVSGYVSDVVAKVNQGMSLPAAILAQESGGAQPSGQAAAFSTPAIGNVPGYTPAGSQQLYKTAYDTGKMPSFGGGLIGKRQSEAFENNYAQYVNQQQASSGTPDPQIESLADSFGTYQTQPPSPQAIGRYPMIAQAWSLAQKKYPGIGAANYPAVQQSIKNFDTGTQGNAVRSLDVGIQHLDVLSQAASALGNGDTQKLNSLKQTFAEQFGSDVPTNFDVTKQLVGDEIAKAIVGGPTAQADREKAQDILSRVNSPEQLSGAIGQIKALMGGQLVGLRQQFTSSTGANDATFNAKLLPTTLDQLNAESGKTAAPAGAPPVGTVQDGYVYNGGDPSQQSSWSKQS